MPAMRSTAPSDERIIVPIHCTYPIGESMASRTLIAAFTLIASSILFASCAGSLLQPGPAPNGVAKHPPSAKGGAEGSSPARPSEAKSCLREGEPCSSNAPACCAGLICVGSRGSFCMPLH